MSTRYRSGLIVNFLPKVEACSLFSCSFFFNDTATTEIYTLSLHDALPISRYCNVLNAVWAERLEYMKCHLKLLLKLMNPKTGQK